MCYVISMTSNQSINRSKKQNSQSIKMSFNCTHHGKTEVSLLHLAIDSNTVQSEYKMDAVNQMTARYALQIVKVK